MHAPPCDRRGRTNKVGPERDGLDGRTSGSAAGDSHSDANKKSGTVRDRANVEKSIADPCATIPGTKMIVPGITNLKKVESLRAYAGRFGPDGQKKRVRRSRSRR